MSLKNLIALIQNPNIANDLSDERLRTIADDVCDRAHEDEQSMRDWADCVDQGLLLCKPDFRPLSTPWDGAANFKSNILVEASNNFGNRATMELMRDDKLVKAQIIGIKTINNVIDKALTDQKDKKEQLEQITQQLDQMQQANPNDQDLLQMQSVAKQIQDSIAQDEKLKNDKKDHLRKKNERADRVAEVMNWQINVKMEDWRKDQKRMLYTLPNIGACFKKTYFDETTGAPRSDVINYPNFIVNQATVSLEECRSFTHIIDVSKNKAKERQLAGLWRDAPIYTNELDGDEKSNEAEGVANARDNRDRFLEQYCWLDLDDDGYDEPYIVTVHDASRQVLRIVARYDYDDIYVKFKDKVYSLDNAIKARAAYITKDNQEYGQENEIPDATDLTGFKVVRIKPCSVVTKYGFIPAPDGKFLDVGYCYLMGSLIMAHNKITNDLLNNGTLATMQGGFTAKGFRKKQGPMKIKPGEFQATEVPAEQFQSSMMPYPFKEPSQTLYALNEKIEGVVRAFAANSDLASQLTGQTAPTTALAMIQESLINQSAHMAHISQSMSDEFKILFRLNRDHLDGDEYKQIVGDDEAVFGEDFNTDGLSICSTANPELSSRMQRMLLADAEMSQIPNVMQAGGNPIPIIKKYFERIGSENIDEIFPNEAEMSPQDKQQVAAMKQSQDQANQMQQAQLQMLSAQTELLKRGEDRKDAEFALKKQETLSVLATEEEQREKFKADVILTIEKALTEKVNNGLSITNAISAEMDKAYAIATSDEPESMNGQD